jgi:hypothetical protein
MEVIMNSTIKAIETVYNGYRFRSRLEARWAVFFDTLGVDYRYEAEGFDLGETGYYLPDFWLPEYKMFVEVKPDTNISDQERAKAINLVKLSGKDLIMVFDCNESKDWVMFRKRDISEAREECQGDVDTDTVTPLACRKCNALGGFSDSYNYVMEFKRHCREFSDNTWKQMEPAFNNISNWDFNINQKLKGAFEAGRQARFEFGR